MKFKLSKSLAIQVFGQAYRTCDTKQKDSPDSNFLFEEQDGKLYVNSLMKMAEQKIVVPAIDLEIASKESFAIPGQIIINVVKQLPDAEITFSYKSSTQKLMIAVDDTRCSFPTQDADTFAKFHVQLKKDVISINGETLATALKHTSFCTAKDTNQAPLTSVHIIIEDGKLTAESTDDVRSSIFTDDIEDKSTTKVDFLLPASTADILSSLIEDVLFVSISISNGHVRFAWDTTEFTAAQEASIGKPFPKLSWLNDVTPIGQGTFSKANLLRSLKLAQLVAAKSLVNVKSKDNGLLITTNEKNGAIQELILANSISGDFQANILCEFFIKAIESTIQPIVNLEFKALDTANEEDLSLVVNQGNYQHYVTPFYAAEEVTEETDNSDEKSEE